MPRPLRHPSLVLKHALTKKGCSFGEQNASSGSADIKPEYIAMACSPDHRLLGGHIARDRDDTIDNAQHLLDKERREGACATSNDVVSDGQEDGQEI